jgi:hypothetical protein
MMMTKEDVAELRERLVTMRDDLLERLHKEFGAGEISLMSGVMAAIAAVDAMQREPVHA